MKKKAAQFLRTYSLFFVLFGLFFILQAMALKPFLNYQRMLVLNGEVWRLLTAHAVHFGWPHFWMNMGAFGLIWLLFSKNLNTLRWLIFMIMDALFISLCVHFLNPEFTAYVGLSGVLHGMLFIGALYEYWHDKLISLATLVLTCAKLIYEFIYGALPGSESAVGEKVLTDAHLYGVIGSIFIFCYFIFTQTNQPKSLN